MSQESKGPADGVDAVARAEAALALAQVAAAQAAADVTALVAPATDGDGPAACDAVTALVAPATDGDGPAACDAAATARDAAATAKQQAKRRARQAKKTVKLARHDLAQAVRAAKLRARASAASALARDPLVTALLSDDAASDPRLDLFRDLKDAGAAARDGLFICEGPEPIRLLLASRTVAVRALLCKPTVYHKLRDAIAARTARDGAEREESGDGATTSFDVLVASHQLMGEVVGYSLNRGALACGRRPATASLRDPEAWLRAHILTDARPCWRVLAVDGCNNTANLGSLVRTGTAFGVDVVLLSADCCDPWYRQAVRVSMGHVFRTPVVRVDDLPATLARLGGDGGCGMVSFAAVIDADAEKMEGLGATPARWCAVLGNEDRGVSAEVRAVAGVRRVRIDMAHGVDSLSITVAAGVFVNGLREREAAGRGWRACDGGGGGAE